MDKAGGGTWVGLNGADLVVAITNRSRGSVDPARRSRGLLCREALQCASPTAALLGVRRAVTSDAYNGFNLLVANGHEAWLISQAEGEVVQTELDDGCHVLTNRHELNAEQLEPVRLSLDDVVRDAVAVGRGAAGLVVARLASCLSDHTERPPDAHAICKHGEHYGTLCATIITLPAEDHGQLYFSPGPPCRTDFARISGLHASPPSARGWR